MHQLRKIFTYLLPLAIVGCAVEQHVVDFKQLTLPSTPNYYLICPKGYCNVKPNAFSPEFGMSVAALQQAFMQLLSEEYHISIFHRDPEHHQYAFVQRTPLLQFPDIINVKLIPLNAKQSTIILYSRSYYGYYDFKKNQLRIEHWIKQLQTQQQS